MDSGEVIIEVGPDGSMTMEVNGVVGAGCTALTDGLRKAMGAQVLERELKPEYNVQTAQAHTPARAHQRANAGQ